MWLGVLDTQVYWSKKLRRDQSSNRAAYNQWLFVCFKVAPPPKKNSPLSKNLFFTIIKQKKEQVLKRKDVNHKRLSGKRGWGGMEFYYNTHCFRKLHPFIVSCARVGKLWPLVDSTPPCRPAICMSSNSLSGMVEEVRALTRSSSANLSNLVNVSLVRCDILRDISATCGKS